MPDTMPRLRHLIDAYRRADATWLATPMPGGDLIADGPEYRALQEIGVALLRLPCDSAEAAAAKIAAVLANEGLYTMIREDEDQGEEMLKIFLSSLMPGDAGRSW